MSSETATKTFFCVFCKDVSLLSLDGTFQNHMETIHQFFFEHDLLLAVNFLDDKEKIELIKTVESKAEESQVESEDIKDETVKDEFERKKPCNRCYKCQKKFKSAADYQQHKETCLKKETCKKCGEKFVLLVRHNAAECALADYSCHKCGLSFKFKNFLRAHLNRTRSSCSKEPLKCKNCQRTFQDGNTFKRHVSKNFCKRGIECEKCKVVIKPLKYKKHITENKCETVLELTCDICLQTFSDPVKSKAHIKLAQCKTKIKCEKCGEKMKEKYFEEHSYRSCIPRECHKCGLTMPEFKLEQHLLRKTSCTVKVPHCDNCDKDFSGYAAFRKHMEKYHGEMTGDVACAGCGKKFRNVANLESHQRQRKDCPAYISNFKVQASACEFCGKYFDRQKALNRHINAKHNTELGSIYEPNE